jgi:hypothetical protein
MRNVLLFGGNASEAADELYLSVTARYLSSQLHVINCAGGTALGSNRKFVDAKPPPGP